MKDEFEKTTFVWAIIWIMYTKFHLNFLYVDLNKIYFNLKKAPSLQSLLIFFYC